jgi:hypothetical protein
MIGISLQLDKLKYQLHRLLTRQRSADLFRRYQRHHFGVELKTFAEGQTGSQAPNHGGHAGLSHRRRKRRLSGIAKGQLEMRHATAGRLDWNLRLKRLKRRRRGTNLFRM